MPEWTRKELCDALFVLRLRSGSLVEHQAAIDLMQALVAAHPDANRVIPAGEIFAAKKER